MAARQPIATILDFFTHPKDEEAAATLLHVAVQDILQHGSDVIYAWTLQRGANSANWGCAMTFASHFAVVTTLSGVWGIPMVAHLFGISPSTAGAPLLAFMMGNAVGSIFLGHLTDRTVALGCGVRIME